METTFIIYQNGQGTFVTQNFTVDPNTGARTDGGRTEDYIVGTPGGGTEDYSGANDTAQQHLVRDGLCPLGSDGAFKYGSGWKQLDDGRIVVRIVDSNGVAQSRALFLEPCQL